MEHLFESREEASLAAAEHIIAALSRRLQGEARTTLVVAGGSSPALCYAELAKAGLEWRRVQLLLSDERWVPPTHADSNEKMLRQALLTGPAAAASLLSLYSAADSVGTRSTALNKAIADLDLPFACVLLGMGDDGHIASLFPDADNLEAGMALDSATFFLPVTTAASPHRRISLTLAALTHSDVVILLFFGAAKRDIYERAKNNRTAYPVSRLLSQKRAPVHVFWAP